jgi:hypothetical protein
MKYWIQTQAPAGNWVDRSGFEADSHAAAVEYFKSFSKGYDSARLVERTDSVVCQMGLMGGRDADVPPLP